MDVSALKRQFAANLYGEPGNPFQAALKMFPDDVGTAAQHAVEWVNDPEVLAEIERLKNDPSENPLPTKIEAAQAAWDLANNIFLKGKERVDALRLFAEIAGHMPDKTINKNIKSEVSANKVMLVKDHGEDSDWEKKLEENQKRLLSA